MKTIDRFAILCALAAAVAACGEKPIDEPVGPVEEPAETRTLTFVLPDFQAGEDGVLPTEIKTKWVAGDQIVVHGEYAKDQVTVTLEAGDISGNGKTASKTVDGLRPYRRDDCSSVLYASYPASASNNIKHCCFYSAFKNENKQLLAACNEGDTFTFVNLSAVITFKVKGDYDGYSFTARKDISIGGDLFQVKITDQEKNLKQYLENPTPTIMRTELTADGLTENVFFVPGGLNLSGGYLLRFYKDGEAIMGTKDLEPFQLSAGTVFDMGDLTDLLTPAADDIDPGLATGVDNVENANCYIINESGLYKFKVYKGNSEDLVVGGHHAEILWETACSLDPLEPRSIIKGVSFDAESNYLCFQTPNPLKPGNALLAVLDANETILWSWHIWIPETPVTEVSEARFATKQAVMSRNLGALVDATVEAGADSRSFGLLYQFGRKDPFPGLGVTDGDTPVAIAGTSITTQEGPITIQESIKHPTLVSYKAKGDWQSDGDPSSLWEQTAKTVYDPCPPGYRLPARDKNGTDTWSGTTVSGKDFFAEYPEKAVFKLGALVFPLAGELSTDTGLWTAGGTATVIWSNHYDSGTVNGYGFDSAEYRNHGVVRSTGGSLRCVVE